jgi:hypothetical protein
MPNAGAFSTGDSIDAFRRANDALAAAAKDRGTGGGTR